MRRVLTLYSTTIGKKVVMASTGILLVGFVIGHMLGNLKLYMAPHDGDYALDHYAEGLRRLGDPFLPETAFLWIFRLVMLGAIALHVWSAWSLKRLSDGARSVRYKKAKYEESNAASRTMFWGGLLLVAFIVFHILHFTTGTIAPGFEFRHGEVQANVTGGLSVWWVALFYALAMVALGMHLYHGVWSMLQTLGINHPRYNPWRRKLAIAIAVVIAIANISFPVAILSGAVSRAEPGAAHAVNAESAESRSTEAKPWN